MTDDELYRELEQLRTVAAADSNRVVSIHCLGAIHAVCGK